MKWILTCMSPVIGNGKRGNGYRPKYRDEYSAVYGFSCEVISGNPQADNTVGIESYVTDDTGKTLIESDADYTDQVWTLNPNPEMLSRQSA